MMKNVFGKLLLFVLVMSLFLTACEFSSANIKEVQLAKDSAGTQLTTTFEPNDTVYALVTLANAPDSTRLKAIWTAVDVGTAAAANTLIDEVNLEAGDGIHNFNLSPSSPFPAGDYKVDIYLNDELNKTLEFTVAGEVAQAADTNDTAVAEPTAAPEPTAESEPTADSSGAETSGTTDGAVNTLEDVRNATVRIVASGSFVTPEDFSTVSVAGQGSGFIIDPEGIAVTNNHVVTGAAFLQVYVEGEDSPRNAKVLGVSECSDLAVIDIDGDGFPYLTWHEGDLNVGLDVYGAGFPLAGNTEYTLTRGIISKEKANGESNWASVDSVLEHDATINPGNSGGPLVDTNGQIVGVNYSTRRDTSQHFAIGRDEAIRVIEQLREGKDVHSIGINGEAIRNEDGSIVGLWVASVESGSPADVAGLQGGDIITNLEGLHLATDGTMADYCDVLRSHNADDTMTIEVLRLATGEILKGQLNGRELETAVLIDLGGDVASGDSYDSYTTLSDASGQLQIDVPSVWTDTLGEAWLMDDQNIGPSIMASTNLDGYLNSWTTPGVFFGASSDASVLDDPASLLESVDFSGECSYDGRQDYSDQLYTGAYDVWSNCGGTGSYFVNLVALPEDGSFVTLVQVQIVNSADLEAFDNILNTFVVLQ